MTLATHDETVLNGLEVSILDSLSDLKTILDAKKLLQGTAFQPEDAVAVFLIEAGGLMHRAARQLTETDNLADAEFISIFSEAVEKLETVRPFIGREKKARKESA
ncbi:hypothetical protein J5N58_12210 [Rhizobium cremeum]|uniref:hypothetical protein n=1 Tax=Rhizobium cremeum TaxID=2813827 RepID=UPI000DDFCB5C|nr:hypothetical protein [Rhizobium cremeum]MCJ7995249.1 hypothetical protein [Rhizobium cremeum]MCJ8000439.1 hypothetical protein [Rhizobium cremeum]